MTSRFRKCKSCFRFTEDWRDAKEKGLKPRGTQYNDFCRKPRKGVKTHCWSAHKKEPPKPKRNAKPKLQHTGEQLCWTCAKAYGGCSWSRAFVPVEGWEAKPSKTHEDGYRIVRCPEYESDLEEYERR